MNTTAGRKIEKKSVKLRDGFIIKKINWNNRSGEAINTRSKYTTRNIARSIMVLYRLKKIKSGALYIRIRRYIMYTDACFRSINSYSSRHVHPPLLMRARTHTHRHHVTAVFASNEFYFVVRSYRSIAHGKSKIASPFRARRRHVQDVVRLNVFRASAGTRYR